VCVIYTGPLLEARVPNIPPTTALKMRLTVPVSRSMLPGASSVVHARLSAGLSRLWHIAALRPVVFHQSEVPVVAAHSSISEVMSVSGFQLVRL
jgi:hypothetical protein